MQITDDVLTQCLRKTNSLAGLVVRPVDMTPKSRVSPCVRRDTILMPIFDYLGFSDTQMNRNDCVGWLVKLDWYFGDVHVFERTVALELLCDPEQFVLPDNHQAEKLWVTLYKATPDSQLTLLSIPFIFNVGETNMLQDVVDKFPFKVVQGEDGQSVYDTRDGSHVASGLYPIEAQLVCNEANAIVLADGTLSLAVYNPGSKTTEEAALSFPRSFWLKFAIEHHLINFFYDRDFGLFTNPVVMPGIAFRQTTTSVILRDWITMNEENDEMQGSCGEEVGAVLRFLVDILKVPNAMITGRATDQFLADWKDICKDAHGGQVRRGGMEAYYQHSFRALEILRSMRGFVVTHEMESAILMHDVLEKTDFGLESLKYYGITPIALRYVTSMTRPDGVDSVQHLLEMILTGDVDLLLCKLADLDENSHVNPHFLWEDWKGAITRYTESKILVTDALRAFTMKISKSTAFAENLTRAQEEMRG